MAIELEVDFHEPIAWGQGIKQLFRPLFRWARYSVTRYLERHAKRYCPKRTGNLAKSLKATSTPFPVPTWELHGYRYGLILEYGSKGWARRRRRPMKPYVFRKEGRVIVSYAVGFKYGRSGRVKRTRWISRLLKEDIAPYIIRSFKRVMIRLVREAKP